MINDWRQQWGYEFPFLWVQLANFMAVEDQPKDSDWAELREDQDRTEQQHEHTGSSGVQDLQVLLQNRFRHGGNQERGDVYKRQTVASMVTKGILELTYSLTCSKPHT